MQKPGVTPEQFFGCDIRVGTIIEVRDFPEARKPAYRLLIDFGAEIGQKRSSAQLVKNYSKEELLGRQIVAVINFPPRQIGPFMSECLVLGAVNDEGDVILLNPERAIPNGWHIA